MKFLDEGFRKLDHEQDRQTHGRNHTHKETLIDATESSTIRFASGKYRSLINDRPNTVMGTTLI